MAKLITPNWHVILIHYPMALLTLGVFIELFSFLWRRSAFRAAGRWMILVGTLLAIPAMTTGIYAFRDAVSQDSGGTWTEVKYRAAAVPTMTPAAWAMMRDHIRLMSIATGVFMLVVVTWVGSSDRLRSRLYFPLMILLLIGTGLLTMGAWRSGEGVYSQAIAQQPDRPNSNRDTDMRNPADPSDGMVNYPSKKLLDRVEWAVPPIQAHALGAGFAVSFAVLALALSLRKMSTDFIGPPEAEDWFNAREKPGVIAANPNEAVGRDERTSVAGGDPAFPGIAPSTYTPASRFWIIACVIALATVVSGLWVADNWTWNALKGDLLRDKPDQTFVLKRLSRDGWHVIFGVAIVVLPLLLAGTTRWISRSRVVLGLLSLLLALAIAGQIWMGILLVYDGNKGSIKHFTPAASAANQ